MLLIFYLEQKPHVETAAALGMMALDLAIALATLAGVAAQKPPLRLIDSIRAKGKLT